MEYYLNETNDAVGVFDDTVTSAPPGWTDATQEEIDAYLLEEAKATKLITLNVDREDFCYAGFAYSGNTFCLSDESTQNIVLKNTLPVGSTDRYKYYDVTDVQRDFADASGWDAFFEAIIPEKDRVMRYYCATKKEINDAATVAAVNAIDIDFSA